MFIRGLVRTDKQAFRANLWEFVIETFSDELEAYATEKIGLHEHQRKLKIALKRKKTLRAKTKKTP